CRAYDVFYAAYEDDDLQDGAGGSTHEAVEYVAHSGWLAAVTVAHEVADAIGGQAAESIPTAPGEWSEGKTITWESARRVEKAAQTPLLRDIFGNPFRPVVLNPTWRTPTVTA